MTLNIFDETGIERSEQTLTSEQLAAAHASTRNLGTPIRSTYNTPSTNRNNPVLPPIKHTVYGKNPGSLAAKDQTFLQIGPHIYGGEVQDIQILENKAVAQFLGVRTSADFLVDSGDGDANIVISLLFSGVEHIYSGLVPLIALFKISPLTSIKNEMITSSLSNEFVDNIADGATKLALDKADEIINKASLYEASSIFIENIRPYYDGILPQVVNLEFFNSFRNNQDYNKLPMWGYYNWDTYDDFINYKALPRYSNSEKLKLASSEEYTEKLKKKLVNRKPSNFVPVAFTDITIQTHTELSDTLIARLVFKRVDVSAYSSTSLLYRSANNTPTDDPLNAYWLRRMLDLYINKYLDKSYVFANMGDGISEEVSLRFAGNDIVLNIFKKEYNLNNLVVQDTGSNRDSVVMQMQIAYGNKFSFVRRAGTSFPTAQFMGYGSGTCAMAIKTKSAEKFKSIHAYKSAADFFIRTQDRFDRFTGWEIRSSIVKMFNTSSLPNSLPNKPAEFKSAWYPIQVQSSTDPDYPNVKNISITFKETNPDFYSDFGFSVYRKGYRLDNLRDFFNEIWDRAVRYRKGEGDSLDITAHTAVFGTGDPYELEYSMVNEDTIAAVFYNAYRFNTKSQYFSPEANDISEKLFSRLMYSKKFSGFEGSSVTLPEHLNNELGEILSPFELTSDFELNNETFANLATLVADYYFDVDDTDVYNGLVNAINKVASGESGRRSLYSYIYQHMDILMNNEFRDSLFAVIARRPKPEVNEHQYSLHGLSSAFSTLSLVLEAKGKELLSDESYSALSQTKRDETKIILDSNNTQSRTETATAYPDYFRATYGELFNVVDGNPLYWKNFAPTFQDMGIINADPKFLEKYDSFTESSVKDAQNQTIATIDSPVPPSIIFYHERLLDKEFMHQVDEDVSNYHDKLSKMRMYISFDIQKVLKDEYGRYLGENENFDQSKIDGLADVIEKGLQKQNSSKSRQDYIKSGGLLVNDLLDQYSKQRGVDRTEVIKKDSSYRAEFEKHIRDILDGKIENYSDYDFNKILTPFLIGTNINAPVAKWKSYSSVIGEGISRGILKGAGANVDLSSFLDNTLVTTENGGVTLSCANRDEERVSMLKIMQRVADNSYSMIRAFPTMRLYLIEFLGPRIIVQDNFWGYNAIISMDITLDKNDADLAVIRIADPFHILQGSAFGSEWAGGDTVVDHIAVPVTNDDPSQGNILERIKLKVGRAIQIRGGYCVDDRTEILTQRGWLTKDELKVGDMSLTLNHNTGLSEWQPVKEIHVFQHDGPMVSIDGNRHSSLTTLGHKWPVIYKSRMINRKTIKKVREWTTSEKLNGAHILIGGAKHNSDIKEKVYSDAFVEIVAWFWTEGNIRNNIGIKRAPIIRISQSPTANPDNVKRISAALENEFGKPSDNISSGNRISLGVPKWKSKKRRTRNEIVFSLNKAASALILKVAPGKVVSKEFILQLTQDQLELFVQISNKADGHNSKLNDKILLSQKNPKFLDALELAAILAGYRTHRYFAKASCQDRRGNWYHPDRLNISPKVNIWVDTSRPEVVNYKGIVWCPTTKNHSWMARRNGHCYFTGNSSDPENLDIIFTGRVAEVEYGDIITIAAQGWKSELLGRTVEFQLNNRNESSVKDLVVTTIQKASPGGIGEEYSGKVTDVLTSIGGNLPASQAIFNSLLNSSGTAVGVPGSGGTAGIGTIIGSWRFLKNLGMGLDTRLRNIWIPDKDRTRLDYFADISDTGWEGKHWVFPPTDAWEILQKATNYTWRYICQVVPYEGEATLFFGRPDQLYYHRDVDTRQYQAQDKRRTAYKTELTKLISEVIEQWYSTLNPVVSNKYSDGYENPGVTLPALNRNSYYPLFKASFYKNSIWDVFKSYKDLATIYKVENSWIAQASKDILNVDVYNDFETIIEYFGDPIIISKLLLVEFYGLNYDYVEQYLEPYVLSSVIARKLTENDLISLKNTLVEETNNNKVSDVLEKISALPQQKIIEAQEFFKSIPQSVRDIRIISVEPGGRFENNIIVKLEEYDSDLDSYINKTNDFINYVRKTSVENPHSIASIQLRNHLFRDKYISVPSNAKTKLHYDILAVLSVGSTFGRIIHIAEEYARLNYNQQNLVDTVNIAQKFIPLSNSPSILSKDNLGDTKDTSEYIIYYMPLYKVFIHSFAEFLRRSSSSGNTNVIDPINKFRSISTFPFDKALNMKVFRDYHYINNYDDIIENNISASTREMFNTVLLRHPGDLETTNSNWYDISDFFGSGRQNFDSVEISGDTEWRTWPESKDYGQIGLQFQPNIILQEKKVAVYSDLNVHRRDQASKVATNVLAKVMRPMYRDNLLILGRVIKPWDVIYLKDDYNDMYGPLEVERVVHHYSAETGWVTNIVPHLMCEANPGNSAVQIALFNNKIDKIFNLVDYGLWALTIASMGSALGVAGIAGIAKSSYAAGSNSFKYILGNLLGSKLKTEATKAGVTSVTAAAAGQFTKRSLFPVLGREIAGNITIKSIGVQLKTLGIALGEVSPAFLKSYVKYNLIGSYVAGAISRLLIQNAQVGNKALPITMMPLIFKGAPLEAGLNSTDYGYWSLSSKIHWAYKDFTSTVGRLFHELTSPNADSQEYNIIKELSK